MVPVLAQLFFKRRFGDTCVLNRGIVRPPALPACLPACPARAPTPGRWESCCCCCCCRLRRCCCCFCCCRRRRRRRRCCCCCCYCCYYCCCCVGPLLLSFSPRPAFANSFCRAAFPVAYAVGQSYALVCSFAGCGRVVARPCAWLRLPAGLLYVAGSGVLCVCLCVLYARACVRVCVRVCMRVCVRACVCYVCVSCVVCLFCASVVRVCVVSVCRVPLTATQSVILLAQGLQHRPMKEVARELDLPVKQVQCRSPCCHVVMPQQPLALWVNSFVCARYSMTTPRSPCTRQRCRL